MIATRLSFLEMCGTSTSFPVLRLIGRVEHFSAAITSAESPAQALNHFAFEMIGPPEGVLGGRRCDLRSRCPHVLSRSLAFSAKCGPGLLLTRTCRRKWPDRLSEWPGPCRRDGFPSQIMSACTSVNRLHVCWPIGSELNAVCHYGRWLIGSSFIAHTHCSCS